MVFIVNKINFSWFQERACLDLILYNSNEKCCPSFNQQLVKEKLATQNAQPTANENNGNRFDENGTNEVKAFEIFLFLN